MSSTTTVQNQKDAILEKAQEQFKPALKAVFGQPAFILNANDDKLVPGASVTAILFLSRFVDMFGDLIAEGNYSLQSYKKHNQERNFQINEDVFDSWRRVGCLND